MDRLKIGITNTSHGVYPFDEAVRKIADQGYDCIDYQGFVDIESDFFGLDEDAFLTVIREQKALFSSHGIEVSQAHAPWRTPRDNDPDERKRWLLAMKKSIRGTAALDCARFVVHPLMPYMFTKDNPDEVWQMNEEFLGEVADYAKELGYEPYAKWVMGADIGVEPRYMGIGPAYAIPKCLKGAGLDFSDVDYWEINEAFAAQTLGCHRVLQMPMEKLNIRGGAIALGHPVGASGARIIVTLVHEMMKREDAKKGLATLCIGGGMGTAVVVEKC